MNAANPFWQSPAFLATLLPALISLIVPILVACLVAYFGLRQLKKQSQIQTQAQIQQDLRKRQADALQAAWALLQSLTTVDNGQNLLRFEIAPSNPPSGKEKRYFLHTTPAQAFVFERLPRAFYESGAGLHWSAELKEHFFECRSILYGLLLKEKALPSQHSTEGSETPASPAQPPARIEITHPDLPKRLETLYESINQLLRKEMQTIYELQK